MSETTGQFVPGAREGAVEDAFQICWLKRIGAGGDREGGLPSAWQGSWGGPGSRVTWSPALTRILSVVAGGGSAAPTSQQTPTGKAAVCRGM